eukprot:Selendium_serpulae@DN6372_c0_g1_i23.p1
MTRRGGLIMLLAASLATASAQPGYGYGGYEPEPYHEEETYGYGHEVDHGYGHEEHGYGHEHETGYGYEPKQSYGHEHDHGYAPKCKEGFYGQCKKDKWGTCIEPPVVGVWEVTVPEDYDSYGSHASNARFIVQFDEYDFCKQSGNFRITNGNGLTESVGYGSYVWVDKKYFKIIDYGYIYGYKYPYPITGSVTYRADLKLVGYGDDKGKSVKPVIGITRDLHGKIIDKVVSQNEYRKLKGPHEGLDY